jgi:uncharacterized membrane protein HdeD (DUF308 family)
LRKSRNKTKPRAKNGNVSGLVIAGIVFLAAGVSIIFHPPAMLSQGGLGRYGHDPVVYAFTGKDSAFIGTLILIMGIFALVVAYRVKNPKSKKKKDDG